MSNPKLSVFPTIASTQRSIDRYLEISGGTREGLPSALDVFLLCQLAECIGARTTVIDLCADRTAGASTALWINQPNVRQVIVPQSLNNVGPWREVFPEIMDQWGIAPQRIHFGKGRSIPALGSQVLVSLALEDNPRQRIEDVGRNYPGSIILAYPFGTVGACPNISAALSVAESGDLSIVLPRELSPFVAASQLGILGPRQNQAMTVFAERTRSMFGGNFQFLDLLHTVTDMANRLNASSSASSELHAKKAGSSEYDKLIKQIHEVAVKYLPADAEVLVVSKGDERLLNLDKCQASHFPQTNDGTYAGHHPADGASATALLRSLRTRGAEYLLIPACYLWWIEHYRELRLYLEKHGSVIACRPDVCIIYGLPNDDQSVRRVRRDKKQSQSTRL